MAARRSPGRSYRRGTSLAKALQQFDTEEKAEAWFVAQRWPDGVTCPFCASKRISIIATRKPQPYRCRNCRRHFSVKTDTLLHSSNIPLTKWAVAFYLFINSLKGISSMKLHRDLGLSQKTAWYMGQRIRRRWNTDADRLASTTGAAWAFTSNSEETGQVFTTSQADPGLAYTVATGEQTHLAPNQDNSQVVTQTGQGVQTDVSTPQESFQTTTDLDPTAYTQISTTGEQAHLATNQGNPQVVTQTEQGVLTEVSIPQESPEMTTNLDAMAYTQVSTTGEQTHLAANQDNSQVIATTDASTSQDSLHMSADLDATDHIIEDAMAGQDLNRGHEAAAPTPGE